VPNRIDYVHFTAERLPKEKTKAFVGILPNDGSTTVKLCSGGTLLKDDVKTSLMKTKDILDWRATKNSEISPRWSVYSDASFRPSLDRYDPVTGIDKQMRSQIYEFLARFKEALKSKNLSKVGIEESDYSEWMKELGMEGLTLTDVFCVGTLLCRSCSDREVEFHSRQKNSHGLSF
jgi:hypothetical protein